MPPTPFIAPFSSDIAEISSSSWRDVHQILEAPVTSLTASSLLLLLFLFALIKLATKGAELRGAATGNRKILRSFQLSAHPLALLQHNERHEGAPLDAVYQAGTREMAHHLTGSSEAHSDFSIRLRTAAKISPSQLRSVHAAMRGAILATEDRLETGLGGMATILRTLPWLACLAPPLTWLESEWAPATHSLSATGLAVAAFAPVGIALVGGVLGQCWWHSLALRVRLQVHGMESFAIELENLLDRWFVDHSRALERLPSIDAFAPTEGPSFSLPPTDSATPAVSND